MKTLVSVMLFVSLFNVAIAQENDSLVSESSKALITTNTLHDRMNIRSRYLPGGQFYLRETVNTFGDDEPLNRQDQVVFCQPGERDFTDTIVDFLGRSDPAENGAVPYDSASFAGDTQGFIGAMQATLENNATNNSQGRFCIPLNDPDVTFKQGGVTDSFCEAGQSLSFTDPASGYSCSVTLDIDLKGGAFRYLRSEIISPPSVGLGYVTCDDEGFGKAQLRLVNNPTSCAGAPGTCVNTCTWVGGNICRASDMPRWGGENCGGQGTQLLINDVLTVNSVDSFSINANSGQLYKGAASMACEQSGESARWRVLSQTCFPVQQD